MLDETTQAIDDGGICNGAWGITVTNALGRGASKVKNSLQHASLTLQRVKVRSSNLALCSINRQLQLDGASVIHEIRFLKSRSMVTDRQARRLAKQCSPSVNPLLGGHVQWKFACSIVGSAIQLLRISRSYFSISRTAASAFF